ncbi:MAG: M42 family metallopeptidase [Eubacteriales bacterium]|nr:M42 family metallopeptidase [Eubacteriales bacterium]
MDERLDLLRQLCGAFGPSGCEDNAAKIIIGNINGLCDDIKKDKLGNIIALYKGTGLSDKRIMICAHMDEVGFMVTHIDDDGYIHFCNVGGIDPRVICGRRVVFGDETKSIHGIVASKAIHQQSESERRETTPVDKMYVDIGAKNKEEAEEYVKPGDFGTFVSDFVLYGNKMMRAKALDNRFGCSVIIEVLRRLNETGYRPEFDLYCVFSTREEIGKAGAITAAYSVSPDIALVIEATAVADIADVPENAVVAKTGGGMVISLIDNGTIYDRELIDFAIKTGDKHNIKYQLKRYVSGSNDAAHIQKSKSGVRICALSAPCRYVHSPSNAVNTDDYFAAIDLVYAMIKDMTITI